VNVTTAIITAAGFGSRMLPITAAVQKELLPILDRPVIDYVVADCLAAGITRTIFVIRPQSHGLQDYYVGDPDLEAGLRRDGKFEAIKRLEAIHRGATFEFIEQPANAGYGTAIPVKIAAPLLPPDEAFVVCGGDDFLWHADGASEIARLITTFQSSNSRAALMALTRPSAELSRYGVLSVERRGEYDYLQNLVEKPASGQAPSNLINISKYVLTPDMLGYINAVTPNPATGEYYLTDALLAAAHDHPVAVHRTAGEYLDSGSVASWLHANLTVAQSRTAIK
jgi:UTP--glucose-1-phosphate uridylyltransferase